MSLRLRFSTENGDDPPSYEEATRKPSDVEATRKPRRQLTPLEVVARIIGYSVSCCCCLFILGIIQLLFGQPTTGACCMRDTGCTIVTQDACQGAFSVFYGVGTLCADHPCNVTCCCATECLATTNVSCPDECMDSSNFTYDSCQAPSLLCPTGGRVLYDANCSVGNPCNTACCCQPDAPIPFTTFEETCEGTFLPDAPTCAVDSCAGACCTDGECSSTLTERECTRQGGAFQGLGTTCNATACPVESRGACCAVGVGSTTCLESMTAGACAALPLGVVEITNTSFAVNTTCTAEPDVCVDQSNAHGCCANITGADGTCTNDLSTFECTFLGGTYLSTAACTSTGACVSVLGACCTGTVNDVYIGCIDVTSAQCASIATQATGAVYSGAGTACATVECS